MRRDAIFDFFLVGGWGVGMRGEVAGDGWIEGGAEGLVVLTMEIV